MEIKNKKNKKEMKHEKTSEPNCFDKNRAVDSRGGTGRHRIVSGISSDKKTGTKKNIMILYYF